MMLSAELFTVGPLGAATVGSLVWPRDEYSPPFLIGQREGAAMAVALNGNDAFHAFPIAGSSNRRGTIVPQVRLEIDVTSAVNLNKRDYATGQVIRNGKRLALVCRLGHGYSSGFFWIDIRDDLPDVGEDNAAFERWNVVLGRGQEKQVLFAHSPGTPDRGE